MTNIIKSIIAINPDAQVTVSADSIDKITWLHGTTPISKEDILAKQVELKAEYDTKQYQRDRTLLNGSDVYPAIEDQLDMMWHDKKDGTTTWEDTVEAVKDAHPKGGS
tara:strand:- start:54 stop:377 length:324 start_codon:yes stop_codon:yes gene_type:complete